MAEWHEEDHPRDDDGKFTYKNGGYSSSEGIVIEGSVEKTDRIGRGKGGGIGDKIKEKAGDIGSVLGNVLVTLLNPQTISAILSILAVKYTASELNEIEQALYNRAALNAEAANINSGVQAEEREKQKMQNRADALYGNDEEYNKKYYPEKELNNKDNLGLEQNNTNTQNTLKELGLENNEGIEYKIDGKTITAFKNNPNENIGVLKVPKNTGNPALEKWKEYARIENTERVKELNSLHLKHNALLEQFGVDNINNKVVKLGEKAIIGFEATENLHMSKSNSYLNTDYAKQHKIYNNYTEVPDNLREYFKTKISEQIGENKLDKTKGAFIDVSSESSNSLKNELLNNSDFVKKLSKYKTAMQNGYEINDSLNFPKGNWHYALGNADIRDMHINENGNIELYITDVYDFNEGEKSDLVRVGRDRQDNGKIIPYFIFYRVIIPKEELLLK